MDNNTLAHWGIKGMKWGVRRYQNADGSLTPAGKKRYDRDIRENNAKKKDNRINIDGPDPQRWVKEDLSRSKNVVDSISSATNKAASAIENAPRKQKRMDLSKMSDQELRARIERERLERNYNDMFAPQSVSRGREAVTKTLKVAGTALVAGATALDIALKIRDLSGKG